MKPISVKSHWRYQISHYGTFIGVLALLMLSILSQNANGQQHAARENRTVGIWKTYRHVDGLAHNAVFSALQTTDGEIWFGTQDGISRFDGRNWINYTEKDGLAGATVRALLQDRTGAIWVATNRGLSRYDGNKWHRVTFEDASNQKSGEVTALLIDREGVVWAGTRRGIIRYAGREWRTVDRTGRYRWVTALLQDKESNIWVGTMNGLYRFDGENWSRISATTPYAPSAQEKQDAESRRITALLETQSGDILVATIGAGVKRFDGEAWHAITRSDGLADDVVHTMMEDDAGVLWFGTETGGVSRYDGKKWETYTSADGLASNSVFAIMQDREGAIWFGTLGGGVSRLDTRSWTVYTQKDGLPSDKVHAIRQDDSGAMWFGTFGGVSRFDGENWQTYTREDDLKFGPMNVILKDKEGLIWVAKHRGGISRFDGKRWTHYTRQNGFMVDSVSAILEDADGHIWFATGSQMNPGKGVVRFDGKNWTTVTEVDGLPKNTVSSIFQDRQGALWFGTGGQIDPGYGVGRFDGDNWITYTTTDGLANNTVLSIFQDLKGDMWFGTFGGGVSRFDGTNWTSYTIADGLGSHYIGAIIQDTEGVMWFGTVDGGISRYDGRTFQTIDSRDGLPNDSVTSVYMDSNGAVWVGTLGGGAIRFSRPKKVQLPVAITKVAADDQVYEAPTDYLTLPAGVKRVVFSFNAVSFKTRPGGMRYYHRLIGKEVDWQPPINAEEIQYFNLLPGDYAFEIQAVDRDFNYSNPAVLNFTIPTPFHETALFLVPAVGGSAIVVGILVMQAVVLFKRRRQVIAYQRIAVEEIKAAREMQLSLLPETAPQIEGFDIAAVCEPATEVGGDYYTYLWLDKDKTHLGIVLMDVTGHGMAAATNAFLASGMLQLESRRGSSPSEILAKMHQSLQEILPKRAFVATSFAQINLRDYTLTYFNAGLPEPILLRKGRPVELQIKNTVPLGCSFRSEHIGTPVQLQKGDALLLFSDGLTEATNAGEDEYERTRMWNLIKALVVQRKPSQGWVDTILDDVRTFTAPTELADDMTVVVVKVL